MAVEASFYCSFVYRSCLTRRHCVRREPCPDRILDDIGGAFGMGAVGGGIWHFGKGLYNSPKGISSRFQGGVSVRNTYSPLSTHSRGRSATSQANDIILFNFLIPTIFASQAVRFEAPRLGGSFAIWGGLFSVFDCTLIAIRKKARLPPWPKKK